MSSNIHSASQETLTKAFQKAYNNGWRPVWSPDKCPDAIEGADPTVVIFNHDFAKALWGEAEHTAEIPSDDYDARDCDNCHGSWINKPYSCWEYRLQQMVIADDPIKYLGENI